MAKSAASYFKGHNFMTPNVIKYYNTKLYAVELSSGRGIYNQPIYGVSVIDKGTKELRPDKSTLFQHQVLAEEYIEQLELEE